MEREKTKKVLLFLKDIDGEISHNNRMIKDYEDRYYTMDSGTLDGMPKSKYKTSSPTEITAVNIPESASVALCGLQKQNEQLYKLKYAIIQELNKLPLSQKTILYDFYIQGLQWVQISERVYYSGTQCKKIRNRGLDNLAKYFIKNRLIKNFNYPN